MNAIPRPTAQLNGFSAAGFGFGKIAGEQMRPAGEPDMPGGIGLSRQSLSSLRKLGGVADRPRQQQARADDTIAIAESGRTAVLSQHFLARLAVGRLVALIH